MKQVASMEEMGNVYKILPWKLNGKEQFGAWMWVMHYMTLL